MPDWIGDQMAGVGPEATRVFGRNATLNSNSFAEPEGRLFRRSPWQRFAQISAEGCREAVTPGRAGTWPCAVA